jgi:PST family polysaccharide transporter
VSLLRASAWSALAVGVRSIAGLIGGKVLAVYVGPAGFALIGQFLSLVSILTTASGGLLVTGVTRGTAEDPANTLRQHMIWRTAFHISGWACLLTCTALLFAARPLSGIVLHAEDYSLVFVVLAVCLPAITANNLLLAIANGKKDISLYAVASIASALIGLAAVVVLTSRFQVLGGLAAYAIGPALALICTYVVFARRDWFSMDHFLGKGTRDAAKALGGFGLMAATTAMAVPVSHIVLREYLIHAIDASAAGYWQAMWKLSEAYLLVLTTTLSLYYLPRLAEIRAASDLTREIVRVYRLTMPVAAGAALAVYFARDFVIELLFTRSFLPMERLFAWQLLGDVIKFGSWILGYVMLGRAMVRTFVVTEVVFSVSLILITIEFVPLFGLAGASMAYALNYTLYWICMLFVVRAELKHMPA